MDTDMRTGTIFRVTRMIFRLKPEATRPLSTPSLAELPAPATSPIPWLPAPATSPIPWLPALAGRTTRMTTPTVTAATDTIRTKRHGRWPCR